MSTSISVACTKNWTKAISEELLCWGQHQELGWSILEFVECEALY